MSRIMVTAQDEANERAVADHLEVLWGVTFHKRAKLDEVDWWVEKRDRCWAYAELKCRTMTRGFYDTIYLSEAKWHDLVRLSDTGAKAIFVVRFADGLGAVDIRKVDPRNRKLGGRRDRTGMPNDWEPIILVPTASFSVLGDG